MTRFALYGTVFAVGFVAGAALVAWDWLTSLEPDSVQ